MTRALIAQALVTRASNARMAHLKQHRGLWTKATAPRKRKGMVSRVPKEAQRMAHSLVTDSLYLEDLQARLNRGEAPQMEILLFRYAFGKPAKPPTLEE